MASARRPMGMVPQRQNLTANSSNDQNQTRRSRLPVRRRQMQLPPHWHMPVRPPHTFPSYPWKASYRQRCRQRRKWRVYFLSCVSVRWSMSILGTSFSSCTMSSSSNSVGLLFSNISGLVTICFEKAAFPRTLCVSFRLYSSCSMSLGSEK